jgi:ribosome-binding protein aMBF1 (putative translation factor)
MAEIISCEYCGEEFEGEPVRRGSHVYCCEACAFEASRSQDCGGRTDSTFSKPAREPVSDEPDVPR